MDKHSPDERPEREFVVHTGEDVHDLRTALTVAMGWTQILQARIERGDDAARFASQLEYVAVALRQIEAVAKRLDRERA